MNQNGWHKRSTPQQIKPLPWLAVDAIAYFESLLNSEMVVLEHGGGGSTLWLASRVKEVITVENNSEWYDVIAKQAPSNVTLCIDFDTDEKLDLMFVDGEPVQARGHWLDRAPKLVKSGGYVVIDNANRPEYAGARAQFAKHAE